jgi:hypothetical protein
VLSLAILKLSSGSAMKSRSMGSFSGAPRL